MNRYTNETPLTSGFYWIQWKNRVNRLDGCPWEVAYLYFDGRWHLLPCGNTAIPIDDVHRWIGPLFFSESVCKIAPTMLNSKCKADLT